MEHRAAGVASAASGGDRHIDCTERHARSSRVASPQSLEDDLPENSVSWRSSARHEGRGSQTSATTTALIAVGGTLAGAGITAWVERTRIADADRHRNHEQRARAAMDFLEAYDAYRRDPRDEKHHADRSAADRSARRLADVVRRMELFFNSSIADLAKEAQSAVDQVRAGSASDEVAIKARDAVTDAMKRQLEPSIGPWWKNFRRP